MLATLSILLGLALMWQNWSHMTNKINILQNDFCGSSALANEKMITRLKVAPPLFDRSKPNAWKKQHPKSLIGGHFIILDSKHRWEFGQLQRPDYEGWSHIACWDFQQLSHRGFATVASSLNPDVRRLLNVADGQLQGENLRIREKISRNLVTGSGTGFFPLP